MIVRDSTDSDLPAISQVHLDAFGPEEGPEIVDLVKELLRDPTAEPRLSLVASSDDRIAGHVLFTATALDTPGVPPTSSILAPVGVLPALQGRGVGSRLVDAGLRLLASQGVDLVFVLGHPDYYPRFGFRPAGTVGFEAPYPIAEKNAGAWMVKPLTPGAEERFSGRVRCARGLSDERHWVE